MAFDPYEEEAESRAAVSIEFLPAFRLHSHSLSPRNTGLKYTSLIRLSGGLRALVIAHVHGLDLFTVAGDEARLLALRGQEVDRSAPEP